jgi:POTRA domain, FtsQ-type
VTEYRRGSVQERAVRDAQPHRAWAPPPFLLWAFGRLLALLVLVGGGWIVYDSASSERFTVRSIRVQGNVLLSQTEIEGAAAVQGANVFWINSAEAAARVRRLPLVQRAHINLSLPDLVEVQITERQPAAFWLSGDRSYLVDREGVILKSVDAEAQQARACAGQPCDPRLASLPTVAQLDGQPLRPGDRVEASALVGSARLATLLPSIGVQPLGFQWSRDVGLEVPTAEGWRVRFDSDGDLDQQVRTVVSIRDLLVKNKAAADLIDVRFGDRPYYR